MSEKLGEMPPYTPQETEVHKPKYVHELFNLSPEEQNDLTQRVAEHNGLIRIFVHPSFISPDFYQGPKNKRIRQRINAIAYTMDKIAASDPKKAPPTIIMDRDDNFEELEANLGEVINESHSCNHIYLAPTRPYTPDPLPPGIEYSIEKSHTVWDWYNNFLKSLGVSKIILSGQELFIYPRSDSDKMPASTDVGAYQHYKKQRIDKGAANVDYVPTSCIGMAVTNLSEMFDVEFSSLTAPNSRIDIINMEKGAPDKED